MKTSSKFFVGGLLFCLTLALPISSHAQVTLNDSLALVSLYDSTNGAGWTDNTNWKQPGQNVGSWYGITVSAGRVTQVFLGANNLVGFLPTEIGDLTAATHFEVPFNTLSGNIPEEIGTMTALTSLRLDQNSITGSIPTQIGNLTNLTGLFLNFNQLTGPIPTEIGSLANIGSLQLNSNQLSGEIPAELWTLTTLGGLIISDNQLTGTIPAAVGDLTGVVSFHVTNNNLSGAIPPEFANLVNMQQLSFSNNSFTDLPDLTALTSLTSFAASGNLFTFDDLEPNASIITTSPAQKPFGTNQESAVIENFPITLDPPLPAAGANDMYQWQKDDVDIPGANGVTLNIPSFAPSDAGTYNLLVTNSVLEANFPGLTLTSEDILLTLEDTTYFKEVAVSAFVGDGSNIGSGWGDIDGNGFDDLVSAGTATNIYYNNGDGTFTKGTGDPLSDNGQGFGPTIGDYDNDGDIDVYAAQNSNSKLFTNNGDGTFTQVVSGDVVSITGDFQGYTWGDFDNDSFLDLYVTAGANAGGEVNYLLMNNQDGTFTTISTGEVATNIEQSVSVTTADYDNDGDMDMYVLNQNSPEPNSLYQNNGDGTFTKVSSSELITDTFGSFGSSWGDFNNDGFMDVFVVHAFNDPVLFVNDGTGNFTRNTSISNGNGAGSTWGDINNDGLLDLMLTSFTNINYLYLNNGDGTFTETTSGSFSNHSGLYGISLADYNNDGSLDFVSRNGDWNLFENTNDDNNYFKINLVGTSSNYAGIGAKVRVKANIGGTDVWQMREITAQTGLFSQNSLTAHYGMGDATMVDSVIVEWPSGIVQYLKDQGANQTISILENNDEESDLLALNSIYDNMGGPDWSDNTNWQSGDPENWFGVTITGNRVTAIQLSNNNLTGTLPAAIDQLDALENLDLSDNDIDALATDFTALTVVSDINLNGNQLDFGDLEAVAGVNVLSYTSQQEISAINEQGPIEIPVNSNQVLTATASGSANSYQWTYEGQAIAGATSTSYTITDIERSNMGAYSIEVSNSLATGVTLTSIPTDVLATAVITANVTDADDALITENVNAYLLEIIDGQVGFDTIDVATQEGVSSSFSFPAVVLADYLINVDGEGELYVPSYYSDTFLWDEADTLKLNSDSTIQITMTETPTELTAADGEGVVSGTIEEDFGDDAARIDARRRAAKRKCGLRRKRSGGRTGQETDVYDLIAYGETNDDGEFEYGFLPQGTYRFFVEYPGIPLDESAFVQFDIGEAGVSDNSFKLAVFASEDGISIELVLGLTSEFFTDFSIFPNPTTHLLNVRYDKILSDDMSMQLIDMNGKTLLTREIQKGSDGQLQVDMRPFESGQYLLRFTDNEKNKTALTFRIIKK